VTHEQHSDQAGDGERSRRPTSNAWYLLFLVPMIGTLIPPIYNTKDPTFIGIPFFYWYLMAWVLIAVVLMVIVNLFTEDRP
jgi:hypothetical protein